MPLAAAINLNLGGGTHPQAGRHSHGVPVEVPGLTTVAVRPRPDAAVKLEEVLRWGVRRPTGAHTVELGWGLRACARNTARFGWSAAAVVAGEPVVLGWGSRACARYSARLSWWVDDWQPRRRR